MSNYPPVPFLVPKTKALAGSQDLGLAKDWPHLKLSVLFPSSKRCQACRKEERVMLGRNDHIAIVQEVGAQKWVQLYAKAHV